MASAVELVVSSIDVINNSLWRPGVEAVIFEANGVHKGTIHQIQRYESEHKSPNPLDTTMVIGQVLFRYKKVLNQVQQIIQVL